MQKTNKVLIILIAISLTLGVIFLTLPFVFKMLESIAIVLLTIVTIGLIWTTEEGQDFMQNQISDNWKIMSYISWVLLTITIALSITLIILKIKKWKEQPNTNGFIFSCVATASAIFLLIIGVVFYVFNYFI
ncbi:hypothetical protein ACJA25_00040 [Mycoplasmopsis hyopharyngis]|uniref:hypothetical protein n=1 Tax=Mycoplasmopsis hyopharyngis TaxID=29558 RepID=UPI003872C24A